MVFGEPVYNSEQRRAMLQQYKDYVDNLRKQKALSLWDVEDEQKGTKKRRKNLSKTKKRKRRKRRKRKTKTTLLKLKKLLCNDRYIK